MKELNRSKELKVSEENVSPNIHINKVIEMINRDSAVENEITEKMK